MQIDRLATYNDFLSVELELAHQEFKVALNQLENCNADWLEVAHCKLIAARIRIDKIMEKERECQYEVSKNGKSSCSNSGVGMAWLDAVRLQCARIIGGK